MTEIQFHLMELTVMPKGIFFGGGGGRLFLIFFLWVLGLHIFLKGHFKMIVLHCTGLYNSLFYNYCIIV
jgi:hypothetical protein